MSKQILQQAARRHSGVSYEESLIAQEQLQPTLLERIGGIPGFEELTERFYDRIFDEANTGSDDVALVNIFSSSTKSEAKDNLSRFLVQTFGGPPLYREVKGKYTRLVGRHANYQIGHEAAARWLHHMTHAIRHHSELKDDSVAMEALIKYFTYTAHYIVVAKEYMRSDQVRPLEKKMGAEILVFLWEGQLTLALPWFSDLTQLSGGTSVDAGRLW